METLPESISENTDDDSIKLKDIVGEDGADARNVLSWRVPNEPSPQRLSSRRNSDKRKKKTSRGSMGSASEVSSNGNRSFLYETGSDSQSEDSRSHFQNRLWRFLFSNITRAVDELYNLCEDENNREYTIEGIKMFDMCKNDFTKLIERMDDQKKFEEGGLTGGVSWEVRKTNIGKRRVLSGGKHTGSGLSLTVDSPNSQQSDPLQTPPPSSPLMLPSSQSGALSHYKHPHSVTTRKISPTSSHDSEENTPSELNTDRTIDEDKKLYPCQDLQAKSREFALYEDNKLEGNTSAKSRSSKVSSKLRPDASPFKPQNLENSDTPQIDTKRDCKSDDEVVSVNDSREIRCSDNENSNATEACTSNKFPLSEPPVNGIVDKPNNQLVGEVNNDNIDSAAQYEVDIDEFGTKQPITQENDLSFGAQECASEHEKSSTSGGNDIFDDHVDREVERETEKVWAQAEAWLEAEMKAEEDAWLLISGSVDNCAGQWKMNVATDIDKLIDRADDHSSVFDLSTDEDSYNISGDKGDSVKYSTPVSSPPSLSLRIDTSNKQGYENIDDDEYTPNAPPLHPLSGQPQVVSGEGVHGFGKSSYGSGNSSPASHTSSITFDDSYAIDDMSLPAYNCGARMLHEKLSSPDRYRRNQRTPEEARRRSEKRQVAAEYNRDKTVEEKKLRAKVASSRVKARDFREAKRIAEGKESYAEKLKEAGKRHKEYIDGIRGKAGNENAKVSEIAFINSLTQQNFDHELQKRLVDTEARIMNGRRRREEHLENITVQQRKRNNKKSQQMSENRLQMEKLKMERWEKLQERLEAVRRRKEERLAELKRRSELRLESPACTPIKRLDNGNGQKLDIIQNDKFQSSESVVSHQRAGGVGNDAGFIESDDMELLNAIIAENNNSTNNNQEIKSDSTLKIRIDCADEEVSCLMSSVVTQIQLRLHDAESLVHREDYKRCIIDVNNHIDNCLTGTTAEAYREKSSKSKKSKKKVKVGEIPTPSATTCSFPGGDNCVEDSSQIAIDKLRKALNGIAITSSSTRSKKKKRKKRTGGENREGDEINGQPLLVEEVQADADKSRTSKTFNFALINEALAQFLPPTNAADELHNNMDDILSSFLHHGGLDLCCELLNIETGLIPNVRDFDLEDEEQSRALKNLLSVLQTCLHVVSNPPNGTETDEDTVQSRSRSDSLVSDTSSTPQHRGNVKQNVESKVNVYVCEKLFASGLALHLVDTLHLLLMALSTLLANSLLPSTLPHSNNSPKKEDMIKNNRSGARVINSSSRKKKAKSSGGRVGEGWGHVAASERSLIEWPLFLSEMIFPLFRIYGHLCKFVQLLWENSLPSSEYGSNFESSDKFRDCTLHWLLSVSSFGLLDTTSNLFRQIQCIAAQCVADEKLFQFLCAVCKSFTAIVSTARSIRWGVDINGLTVYKASLCLPPLPCHQSYSDPNQSRSLMVQLYHKITNEITRQDLSSHLVSLLGELLLQDANRASSRSRRQDEATIINTVRSLGIASSSGKHEKSVVAAPILVVCYELLVSLNSFCCFDLESAQNLPQDLKASSALIAERLLLVVFPLIEEAKLPKKNPSALDVTVQSSAKATRMRKRRSEKLPKVSDRPVLRSLTGQQLEDIIDQLLMYLGYLSLNCQENQKYAAVGPPPSLLVRLCSFPILYFSDDRLKQQLLPSLICCCYRNEHNRSIISKEMSLCILSDFLMKALKEKEVHDASISSEIVGMEASKSLKFLRRLSVRFPVEFWEDAYAYFSYAH